MRSVIFLDWRILFEVFVDYFYFMGKVENNVCFIGEIWNKVGCVKIEDGFIYCKYFICRECFFVKSIGLFFYFWKKKLFWYLK